MQVLEAPVDLAELLVETLRMSEPLAVQHGVTLRFLAEHGSAPGALADPMRLRQVLLNLVSNGIKYNRPGGTVRVELSGEGEQVHVDVIDTGIGMTREQLDHLYEPFNRLGRERGGIEGTGIGLAITLQLVQLMGGGMTVSSESGVGTRVRVSLRAIGLVVQREVAAIRPAEFDGDEVSGVVLYIEDNPVNSLLVEQLLSRWPAVRVMISPDGRSGIAEALRWCPDLVLLDMQLPDMDGIQVLETLRNNPRSSELRVVALSASAMPEEREAAKRAGADDYWTKPIDFDAFLRNVRLMLRAPVA
jgi:CheY-like chemotaxis protein/anti-sigma regulatory factor (Ser/Thr protein kinase)